MELREYPPANRFLAATLLAAPAISGNIQAVKLRYMLATINEPTNFGLHLELLQSLQESGPTFTPQMELELGILLFQKDRAHEGDRQFKRLRSIWRKRLHYGEVPPTLHWLLDSQQADRRRVQGKVVSKTDGRGSARIQDLDGTDVPFRLSEFGKEHRVGEMIHGYVSFGHNGPLLRPLTATRR